MEVVRSIVIGYPEIITNSKANITDKLNASIEADALDGIKKKPKNFIQSAIKTRARDYYLTTVKELEHGEDFTRHIYRPSPTFNNRFNTTDEEVERIYNNYKKLLLENNQ